MAYSIGECLYGEHDETGDTLTKARGYLILAPNGDHVAIVPGADEAYTERTEGAAMARQIVSALRDRAALLAALHTLSANLELWHNAEDDDHENHIIGDCEETIRAAIAQAEGRSIALKPLDGVGEHVAAVIAAKQVQS